METCLVNIAKSFLIMLNNLQQMHSKLVQNEQFKKTTEVNTKTNIYIQTRVSSFPTTREQLMPTECSKHQVLSFAETLVVNEQKMFCSNQCSPECSMNKFRACIYIYIHIYNCVSLTIGNKKACS